MRSIETSDEETVKLAHFANHKADLEKMLPVHESLTNSICSLKNMELSLVTSAPIKQLVTSSLCFKRIYNSLFSSMKILLVHYTL